MRIQQLVAEAGAGRWAPVYVLVGAERLLIDRAVQVIRRACAANGIAGFNDDVFAGKGLKARTVLGTARTLPMMAAARFVLVRGADAMDAGELDALTDYLGSPAPTTCLALTAEKLDGRTRFAKAAKKTDVWIDVEVPKGPAIRDFVQAEAKARGHAIEGAAVTALVDAVGGDLSGLDDALERVSLFVGKGMPIGVPAVEACVTRVRVETIWALVDAISARNKRRALDAVASLLSDREPPLRVLAMVVRQLRMIARMREALASGLGAQEAAKAAGAPPFKAAEMATAAKAFDFKSLRAAFAMVSSADRALKGSKRPAELVLEQAVVALCRA